MHRVLAYSVKTDANGDKNKTARIDLHGDTNEKMNIVSLAVDEDTDQPWSTLNSGNVEHQAYEAKIIRNPKRTCPPLC